MAPLELNKSDNLLQIEWLTTFAFLGALCCAVAGVKFKWFRAQLTLDTSDGNESSVEVKSGVYRPYSSDIYSPSYREINESPLQSRPQQVPNKPQVTITSNPSVSNVARPTPPDPTVQSTSNGAIQKDKDPSNKKVKAPDKTPKDKARSDKIKKAKIEIKAKKEKEEKEKEEKRLKKEEKLKKEKEEKEEKSRKEKEEKLLKQKEKKDKNKKGKKTSEPVASVTIDAEAVASAQNPEGNTNTKAVPPPYTKDPPLKNPTSRNKNTKTEETEPDGGFTSSWDMVTAHRQNLQREVKLPANNNLRSMANQNNAVATARNNNLSMPSSNSNPLANSTESTVVESNAQIKRFSDASNNSQESDTEA